jgi:tetratricopeptide (TPR) repeat protein
MIAGVARDGLTRLAGEPLIATKTVRCPAPAQNVHGRANALYGARRYAEAVQEYGRATAACPENSSWWVELADSYYELEDYERARTNFVKALSVDRWNREAHRYLSDTYVQLDDNESAVRELVLAVVSDPTYEAGWSALRAYGTAMGRKWSRVHGDRSTVPGNADGAGWIAYDAAKAAARRTLAGSASALAVEREAVRAALKAASGGAGPFWSMLARAERGGFLDEAIFLHLLDAALGDEYPAFRETNAARLTSYLETVLLR